MWPRFRNSFMSEKEKVKKIKQPCRGFNLNEEYLRAVRTKSFADFFVKAKILSNEPSSSQVLLDPGQDAITSVLESSILSNESSDHHLKPLLFEYFNISAEASSFCSQLLKRLNQIQADHRSIHRTISTVDPDSEQFCRTISDLRSHHVPDLNTEDFNHFHEKHSYVLQRLNSNSKRVARKIKMIKLFNRASGQCVTAGVLIGHSICNLPMKTLQRKLQSFQFLKKYEFLAKSAEQIDAAAKGAYILNRDFDTMGRLAARLQDEIEHGKAMIEFCLERRKNRVCLQVLKELERDELGFSKQAEELEEHAYLCLVTINMARALVVKEIECSR